MASLHRGLYVVVHLYSTFSVDPKNFPRGKFIPKIAIFEVVGMVSYGIVVFNVTLDTLYILEVVGPHL